MEAHPQQPQNLYYSRANTDSEALQPPGDRLQRAAWELVRALREAGGNPIPPELRDGVAMRKESQ